MVKTLAFDLRVAKFGVEGHELDDILFLGLRVILDMELILIINPSKSINYENLRDR